MSAQPDTPGPDTGSYEVIHLGGQAAVVVPVADFLRLRALEKAATPVELEAAAFLDDPQGIRAVLDTIDRLADDPRPTGSFPYGSPDLRRLRVGRYRILYEITEDAIAVRHIARGTAGWYGQTIVQATGARLLRGIKRYGR